MWIFFVLPTWSGHDLNWTKLIGNKIKLHKVIQYLSTEHKSLNKKVFGSVCSTCVCVTQRHVCWGDWLLCDLWMSVHVGIIVVYVSTVWKWWLVHTHPWTAGIDSTQTLRILVALWHKFCEEFSWCIMTNPLGETYHETVDPGHY